MQAEEIARKSGVNQNVVSEILNNHLMIVSDEDMRKISSALQGARLPEV